MLNTLASGRSVLVRTVLNFFHRCFLHSILDGRSGGHWHGLRMSRLPILLCLALRLEPVLICLAVVAASLLIDFIGPLGDLRFEILRIRTLGLLLSNGV